MDADEGFVFDVPEAEETPEEKWNTREVTIFMIDCTKNMIDTRTADGSYFQVCIKCCKSAFMNKIIGSSYDCLGIVLYGTEKNDPGDQNAKNVFTFFEPSQPNADIIRTFDKITKVDSKFNFKTEYGCSEDYSLPDVLWHALALVNKCPIKFNIQRFVLMTCNDNPHENDPVKQHQTRKRAEDLHALKIEFDVIPLGEQFNADLFYNEIMEIVNGPESKVEATDLKIEKLLTRTYRKDYKKRSVGKIPFNLGGGVSIDVCLYNLYRPLRIPSIMKLDRRTNEPMKNERQTYNAETGERLLRTDLSKYVEIGNKRIHFSVDEMKNLRLKIKPGITLLGFKSLLSLTPEYYFRPSTFIFPTDEKTKGCTLLFTTLLRRCIAKHKFALCYFMAREGGRPWLAALVPQEEQRTDVKVTPAGFHVICLPYAENIREIPLPPATNVTPEQVDLWLKVLKKLTFQYETSIFENPGIQTHWANIEALALNYAEPRAVVDETVHDYDEVSARLRDSETNLVETFFGDTYDPLGALGTKRKYPAYAATGTRSKFAKLDPEDPDYVEKVAKAGFAEKLTVPVLRKFLSDKGVITAAMKKADMLRSVKEIVGDPVEDE